VRVPLCCSSLSRSVLLAVLCIVGCPVNRRGLGCYFVAWFWLFETSLQEFELGLFAILCFWCYIA
jgi:hypothetical protein